MAFDEECVRPAAVAIATLFERCSRPHCLRLAVVDLGLSQVRLAGEALCCVGK